MKRIIALSIALVMLISIAGCSFNSKDESLDKVLNKKAFIMGFNDDFVPMGFKDDNGTYLGYDIDIAKEISKRLDVTLNLQIISRETGATELLNKTVDFLGNAMTASKEHEKELKYSKPIFKNNIVVAVLEDSEYKNFSDLKDKNISVAEGTLSAAVLDENKSLKNDSTVLSASDNNAVLSDLFNKRADAIVVDETFVRYQMSRGVKIRIMEKKLKGVDYCLVFRKADKKLLKRVNKLIDEIRKDGTLEGISAKWFGDDFAS